MMEPRFAKNSSFSSRNERRRRDLGVIDRVVIRLATAAFSVLPLRWIDRIAGLRESRRGVVWPDWCWRRRDAGSGNDSLVSSGPVEARRSEP